MSSTKIPKKAKLRLNEKDYDLPKLNFKRIKRIWPHVQKLEEEDILNKDDPNELMNMIDIILEIFVIALNDSTKDKDWIEEEMQGEDLAGLQGSLVDLLIISGLAKKTEDGVSATGGAGAATAATSTETGTA